MKGMFFLKDKRELFLFLGVCVVIEEMSCIGIHCGDRG